MVTSVWLRHFRQFLQCCVDIDRIVQTETFFFRSRDFAQSKLDAGDWNLDAYNRFITHLGSTIQTEQVDVLNFSEEVIEATNEQDEFVAYMSAEEKGLRTLSFRRAKPLGRN